MLEIYLAKKKMKVKEYVQYAFFTTLWKNDIVMGFFDLRTKEITRFTCFRTLELFEIEQLKNVIIEYLGNINKKSK